MLVLPLSVLSVLTATSRYHHALHVLHSIMPPLFLNRGVPVLAGVSGHVSETIAGHSDGNDMSKRSDEVMD